MRRIWLTVIILLVIHQGAAAQQTPMETYQAHEDALLKREIHEDWMGTKGYYGGQFWFYYMTLKEIETDTPDFVGTYGPGSKECVFLADVISTSTLWLETNFGGWETDLYTFGNPRDKEIADEETIQWIDDCGVTMAARVLTLHQLQALGLDLEKVNEAIDRANKRVREGTAPGADIS